MINDKTPPKTPQTFRVFNAFDLAIRYANRNRGISNYFQILKLESSKCFHVYFYKPKLTGKKYKKIAEFKDGQYNEF